MQILEYNPFISTDLDQIITKKRPNPPFEFKSYSINDIILLHHLENKLKKDYLTEFAELREFKFVSFPDNIYLIGLNFLLESLEAKKIHNLSEFIANNLKTLLEIGSEGFFDTLCNKVLGRPYNMLFVQEIQDLFERFSNLDDFRRFVVDPLNFKENGLLELLMKILSYQIIITTQKSSDELLRRKKQIENYFLSQKKEFLDYESKFVLASFCESFTFVLQILTLHNEGEMRIIEHLPSNEFEDDINATNIRNIVIFNDATFKVYYLERILKETGKMNEESPIKSPIKQSEIKKLRGNTSLSGNERHQDNMKENNKPNENKQRSPSLPIKQRNNEIPPKTLCLTCARQPIFDDYNRLSIYIILKCEGCNQKICSVHKENIVKCPCFCNKCENHVEKRYHFKRSAEFGYGDDCFEIMHCEKCKIITCLQCEKKMENYDDLCDCQCTVCFKKILNKFDNGRKNVDKCKECQLACKKCLIKTLNGTRCTSCGENYCRVCFHEIILAGKTKKEEEIKKNGKTTIKNATFGIICGFCEENKKNIGKFQKEKSIMDRLFH